MYVHHETDLPHHIFFQFTVIMLLLRRLYRHRVHSTGYNCHSLAYTLAPLYKMQAVSGWLHSFDFKNNVRIRTQHSWIKASDEWIIDVKPVGCVAYSPLLIRIGKQQTFGFFYEEGWTKSLRRAVQGKTTTNMRNQLRKELAAVGKVDRITEREIQEAFLDGTF